MRELFSQSRYRGGRPAVSQQEPALVGFERDRRYSRLDQGAAQTTDVSSARVSAVMAQRDPRSIRQR